MNMATTNQRLLALSRAVKMLELFKSPAFDNITAALDMPTGTGQQQNARKAAFDAALPAWLVQSEKEWLWNYLERCNRSGAGGWGKGHVGHQDWLPEAASSGW